jgi:SAM-dependent methyltransferase
VSHTSATFEFEGFSIPQELAVLTGGGGESWAHIARAHLSAYERFCPIEAGQRVLEVGCGVGRDAIPLSEMLGSEGRYVGVDIIEPSISWCRSNITPRRPNTRFEHLDVHNSAYNPEGSLSALEVRFPVEDGWADRIVLQSVFTHMFAEEVARYLTEFRRILAPDGRVFATFFVTDWRTLRTARRSRAELDFRHRRGRGCRICDPGNPPGAVGYTPAALGRMLRRTGMAWAQPIHRGFWSGRTGVVDGQDIAVLRRRP